MAFWYSDMDFYNPWAELRSMQRRMNRLMSVFEDDIFDLSHPGSARVAPSESKKQITHDEAGSKDKQPEEKSITTTNSNQQRDLFSFSNLQWRPVWDVKENEKEIAIHVELPGVEKDSLSLKVENNVLTLSGEKKHETSEKNDKYHRVERSYGRFSRSIRLPEGVDPSSICANYNDGVLAVTIPKPPQSARQGPLTIEIQRKTPEQSASQPQASSDPSS
jgi:HSP20 family protein